MRWFLIYAGLNAALLGIVLLALWAGGDFSDLGLSMHGWIALTLGVSFTAAVAVALMGLVFYSDRSDRDQGAGGSHRDESA